MEYWHGFETARNVAQLHETTIADITSNLSAHFVTVPARSLGGSSYLFQGSDWPLETLEGCCASRTCRSAAWLAA